MTAPLPTSTTATRHGASRDAALVAVCAGVVAALGLVPALPMPSGVPVSAQTLGVVLAGTVLGARRGCSSLLLVVALVAVGLPLLAGGRGGLGVFDGPSSGFVVGYPVAALVTGFLTERFTGAGPYRWGAGLTAGLVGGVLVEHVFGALGFLWATGASPVVLLPLVPADLLMAVLAVGAARRVHAAHPGLLPRPPER